MRLATLRRNEESEMALMSLCGADGAPRPAAAAPAAVVAAAAAAAGGWAEPP